MKLKKKTRIPEELFKRCENQIKESNGFLGFMKYIEGMGVPGTITNCILAGTESTPKMSQRQSMEFAYYYACAYTWGKYKKVYNASPEFVDKQMNLINSFAYKMDEVVNIPYPCIYIDLDNFNLGYGNGNKICGAYIYSRKMSADKFHVSPPINSVFSEDALSEYKKNIDDLYNIYTEGGEFVDFIITIVEKKYPNQEGIEDCVFSIIPFTIQLDSKVFRDQIYGLFIGKITEICYNRPEVCPSDLDCTLQVIMAIVEHLNEHGPMVIPGYTD